MMVAAEGGEWALTDEVGFFAVADCCCDNYKVNWIFDLLSGGRNQLRHQLLHCRHPLA